MSGEHVLFSLFAISTCASAVAVVVSQNIVRMAFWLIVSLGSTAGLFFLLHADFVAATQMLVYVGGTLVLLIFGVMLTASGPYLRLKIPPGQGIMAAGIGCVFLAMIFVTVVAVDWNETIVTPDGFNEPGAGNTARGLGLSLLGFRPDKDLGAADGSLSTGYLLPFEIISVHLLVVLIGAAYLARAKRRVASTDTEN